MDKPNTVYVTYIAATPDHVWGLLTAAGIGSSWLSGDSIEMGSAVGDRYCLRRTDGSLEVDGAILAIEPGKRLLLSWIMPDLPIWDDDDRVEFLIEDKGCGVARLAVQNFHGGVIPENWIAANREAWSLALASLKSLAETGKPLPLARIEPLE